MFNKIDDLIKSLKAFNELLKALTPEEQAEQRKQRNKAVLNDLKSRGGRGPGFNIPAPMPKPTSSDQKKSIPIPKSASEKMKDNTKSMETKGKGPWNRTELAVQQKKKETEENQKALENARQVGHLKVIKEEDVEKNDKPKTPPTLDYSKINPDKNRHLDPIKAGEKTADIKAKETAAPTITYSGIKDPKVTLPGEDRIKPKKDKKAIIPGADNALSELKARQEKVKQETEENKKKQEDKKV